MPKVYVFCTPFYHTFCRIFSKSEAKTVIWWNRNALPTARFFFPRRVSALWKKNRGGGGRRPSSGRPQWQHIMRETETLSWRRDFFFPHKVRQHLVREKKSSPRRPIGRAAPTLLTTYHARNRNALPTARFFFPRRVSALWKKNRGGGGRRPSSGRPSDNISCERPRRSPDLYYFIFFTFL